MMKKLVVGLLLVVRARSPRLGPVSGCADACADLREICGQCTDRTYAEACRQVVNEGNDDVCTGQAADFAQFCQAVTAERRRRRRLRPRHGAVRRLLRGSGQQRQPLRHLQRRLRPGHGHLLRGGHLRGDLPVGFVPAPTTPASIPQRPQTVAAAATRRPAAPARCAARGVRDGMRPEHAHGVRRRLRRFSPRRAPLRAVRQRLRAGDVCSAGAAPAAAARAHRLRRHLREHRERPQPLRRLRQRLPACYRSRRHALRSGQLHHGLHGSNVVCGGGCVDVQSDTTNCGTCENVCAPGRCASAATAGYMWSIVTRILPTTVPVSIISTATNKVDCYGTCGEESHRFWPVHRPPPAKPIVTIAAVDPNPVRARRISGSSESPEAARPQRLSRSTTP